MNRCHFDPSPHSPPVPTTTVLTITTVTATSSAPTTSTSTTATSPTTTSTPTDTHDNNGNNNSSTTAVVYTPTEVDNTPTFTPMLHHTSIHIEGGTIDADNNGRALGIFRLVYYRYYTISYHANIYMHTETIKYIYIYTYVY